MLILYHRKKNTDKYPQQINCFELHSSITTTNKQSLSYNFTFQKTNMNELIKIISQLNAIKSCQNGDIPTRYV